MTHTMPSWTFSQLESFATCPKQFFHLKVARDVVDPPNVHSEWGDRVHKALEARLKTNVDLPEGMQHWESMAGKVAALPGQLHCEFRLALDEAFQPAPWKQSWTRGIADVLKVHRNRAAIMDWKTGGRKPSEQLRLYAAYTFAHFPTVDYVDTAFIWLKEKKIYRETVNRDQAPVIWREFLPKVNNLKRAYDANRWPERPSGLCRKWCPVKTCKYNGQR